MMKYTQMKKDGRTAGFTLMELVVTIALMGVLMSFAVPAYNGIGERMQGKRNIANMHTIREQFFHYFYEMHQQRGRVAHFPPAPDNDDSVMDNEWSRTPMDSTLSPRAPKDLFSTFEVPKNSNNNPFKYETWRDTIQVTGEVMRYIKLEDIDEDSPSHGKSFTYSI
jgi:prepilin-type N-terminal cleavage/methylation domain-containing protein